MVGSTRLASAKPAAATSEQLERLAKTGWEVVDGSRLSKGLKFEGKSAFRRTWAFMTDVARKADELNHHPDWTNSYSQVVLELQTHSERALTALDIELATAIDEAAERWAVATELPEIGKSVP